MLGSGAGGGGKPAGIGGSTASIVLAGVAVAALLTAIQEYLQQQHAQELQQIYTWILGSLSLTAGSGDRAVIPRRPPRGTAPTRLPD